MWIGYHKVYIIEELIHFESIIGELKDLLPEYNKGNPVRMGHHGLPESIVIRIRITYNSGIQGCQSVCLPLTIP